MSLHFGRSWFSRCSYFLLPELALVGYHFHVLPVDSEETIGLDMHILETRQRDHECIVGKLGPR
jgi:hypothetical protein